MRIDFDADVGGVKDYISQQELIQRIAFVRDRLPFSRVLRQYGVEWAGDDDHQLSCHFHGVDRHPSAHYYAESKRYWCFACPKDDAGGDIVWWIKKRESLPNMAAALDFIAKNFGVGFDGSDLTQRIKMLEETKQDPKRELVIGRCTDKVNDQLYSLRKEKPHLEERWDALEHHIFDRKHALDGELIMGYMDTVRIYRDWVEWANELLSRI